MNRKRVGLLRCCGVGLLLAMPSLVIQQTAVSSSGATDIGQWS